MKALRSRISEHLKLHGAAYLCFSMAVLSVVFISLISAHMITNSKYPMPDIEQKVSPIVINIIVHNNDSIMSRVLDEVSDIKMMVKNGQNDTLQIKLLNVQ